jgi:tetratricopeptide (TPR) repeat protein
MGMTPTAQFGHGRYRDQPPLKEVIEMGFNPEISLKMANSLLSEVIKEIEPFQQDLQKVDAGAGDEAFLETMKADFQLARKEAALMEKLKEAMTLAASVRKEAPGLHLDEGEPLTAAIVIAKAHLCEGILHASKANWPAAEIAFRQAVSTIPTPDAQLRVGYAVAAQGNRDAANVEFQRILTEYPRSDEAVEAAKAIRELERMPMKRRTTALILSIFLGWAGVDRFYLGYWGSGVVKLLTFGGFYVWWIIDIIRILANKLPAANGLRLER